MSASTDFDICVEIHVHALIVSDDLYTCKHTQYAHAHTYGMYMYILSSCLRASAPDDLSKKLPRRSIGSTCTDLYTDKHKSACMHICSLQSVCVHMYI